MFAATRDAKSFILDRAREQCQREGAELTPAEEYGLALSLGEDCYGDRAQADFEQSYPDPRTFECWARELLTRAYERDRRKRPELAHRWRESYASLDTEDHYLGVLLRPVVGSGYTVRPRTRLFR